MISCHIPSSRLDSLTRWQLCRFEGERMIRCSTLPGIHPQDVAQIPSWVIRGMCFFDALVFAWDTRHIHTNFLREIVRDLNENGL